MPEAMRALRKERPGPGVQVETVPVPRPGPGEVLIEVRAASVCGTDYHIYAWDDWAAGRVRPPLTLGHEFCGHVVQVGEGVDAVGVGDFVSCESHLVCGECRFCRTGQGHICSRTRVIGVDTDGCFAAYVKMPARNCWVNDPDLPPELASIQEPLGNAVYAALAGPLTAESVAVTGCGPIGLMSVAVCKQAGAAPVFAIDPSPFRRRLAQELGADLALDPLAEDPVPLIRRATGGDGPGVVLEMSGSPAALRQALSLCRPGGRVSLLGIPPGSVELPVGESIIFKGLTVQGITGRRVMDTWFQVDALMRAGLRRTLAPIITHTVRLEELPRVMDLMREGRCGKVVLLP